MRVTASQDPAALASASALGPDPTLLPSRHQSSERKTNGGKEAAKNQYQHQLQSKTLLKAEHHVPQAWRALRLHLSVQLTSFL